MWRIPGPADLVTFIEEVLNGKIHFFFQYIIKALNFASAKFREFTMLYTI